MILYIDSPNACVLETCVTALHVWDKTTRTASKTNEASLNCVDLAWPIRRINAQIANKTLEVPKDVLERPINRSFWNKETPIPADWTDSIAKARRQVFFRCVIFTAHQKNTGSHAHLIWQLHGEIDNSISSDMQCLQVWRARLRCVYAGCWWPSASWPPWRRHSSKCPNEHWCKTSEVRQYIFRCIQASIMRRRRVSTCPVACLQPVRRYCSVHKFHQNYQIFRGTTILQELISNKVQSEHFPRLNIDMKKFVFTWWAKLMKIVLQIEIDMKSTGCKRKEGRAAGSKINDGERKQPQNWEQWPSYNQCSG